MVYLRGGTGTRVLIPVEPKEKKNFKVFFYE